MANAYRRLVMQCLAALVCSVPIAHALAYDWLQFGGNPQHSGNNTAETILNPGNIASLVQKYQANLPAIADGAPVFLEAVTTPVGVKNRVAGQRGPIRLGRLRRQVARGQRV